MPAPRRSPLDPKALQRAREAKTFSEVRLAETIERAQRKHPERNFSVPAIAVGIGLSPQTVYNWLKPRAHKDAAEPRISDARRLADFLECDVEDFLA